MKFKVTMKDPDGPYDSIRDAAKKSVAYIEQLSASERVNLVEFRTERLREFTDRWFEYGECLTIEFDTEAGTATVCEAK